MTKSSILEIPEISSTLAASNLIVVLPDTFSFISTPILVFLDRRDHFPDHNLGKQYKRRWAVHHVDLEVHRGDVFGFLGPNGAGKSTTIRMLLSLIRPTEGEVFLFGRSLDKEREKALNPIGGNCRKARFLRYLSAIGKSRDCRCVEWRRITPADRGSPRSWGCVAGFRQGEDVFAWHEATSGHCPIAPLRS